jgi:hypothetical protein
MTLNYPALSRFIWHFDAFTGLGTHTDEDWIWHVLLVYASDEERAALIEEGRRFLLEQSSDEASRDAYIAMGGTLWWGRSDRAKRFVEITIELAPAASRAYNLGRAERDDEDAWTRTPRPRLAGEPTARESIAE